MHNRLFIAISYDGHQFFRFLQQKIMEQLQPLVTEYNGTLKPQNHIHMTLFFLGEKPQADNLALQNRCGLDIDLHIKKYGLGSLLEYTSRISIKIIGHGVIAIILEPSELLSNLHALFARSFDINQKETRSFLPHVTVARIKKIEPQKYNDFTRRATEILDEIEQEFQEAFCVGTDILILFSSDRSEYKEIAKFYL